MLGWLGELAVRRARTIVMVALALALAAAVYGAGVARALAPGGFEVRGGEAGRVAEMVETRFGRGTPDVVALVHREGASADDPDTRRDLAELAARVRADPRVAAVIGPDGPAGAAMISVDRRDAMLVVSLRGGARDKEESYPDVAALLRADPSGLAVEIGGAVAVAVVAQQTAEHDLQRGELVAFPLVAVLLAWFFRGRIALVIPLGVGALAIAFATAVLRLLALASDISIFALNIVTLLGFGLAIDYSLFIVQRFREELAVGTVREATVRTVVSAGKTAIFSGVAVAVSLLALLVFPIALLHSVAIAGALIVALTMIASLLVLPALLAWMGPRIEWPRRAAVAHGHAGGRGWAAVAAWVMRRPIAVALGTTALLLACGAPVLRLETAISDARIFPAEFEVRRVQERLQAPAGFAAGDTVEYMLVLEGDGDAWADERLAALFATHASLIAVPGVEHVDDLVGALGAGDRATFMAIARGLSTSPPAALGALVDRDATAVRVVADAPLDAPARAAQVAAIRAAIDPSLRASVGGTPAVAHEVDRALLRGALPASLVVVTVTLLVLTLAFGAIVVAVKAVIMNVLSLAASFGALVWLFQDGRFETLLRYDAIGTIDPLILLVMFAIVFGLSMDYELFLLSRIREDYGATGDAHDSVARGLAATGRLITMAGAMLIVVLLGFASGEILFVKQLGVGMAIAVAVDATVVRALLVPATMRLLGRWNWWAAGWFERWWVRAGIGVRELPPGGGSSQDP